MKFEDIVQEYHPIIYSVGRSYADPSQFEDLYQEILIQLWKGFASFRGDAKLSTWIYRVALNTSMTFLRDRKRKTRQTQEISEAIQIGVEDIPLEVKDQIDQLQKAIRKLPEEDRSIIILYLDDYPYKEIAEIIGLSANHIGVKINRIKKKLLTELKALQ
jgi:RNA polymerase sigma-70 factor (ECF subfamily)